MNIRPGISESRISHAFDNPAKTIAFKAVLAVVLFVGIRLFIQPINTLDFDIHIEGLREFWAGRSPYTVTGFYDPPWGIPIIAPLVNLSLETWLALSLTLFLVAVVDTGSPFALFLLLHPIAITLIASSNPEWLYVGPGVWLLYYAPRGVWRGIAWLFLAVKPQTTFILLIADGIAALRQRDWYAAATAGGAALIMLALFPDYWSQFQNRLEIEWSATVMFHWGVLGALAVTLAIVALRYRRLHDYKTLGILLAPVWSPYLLQYGYMAVLFTLRNARWWLILLYVVAGIGLAALTWQEYHVAEHIGTLGMVLLAAAFAPAYVSPSSKHSTGESAQAL